MGKSQRDKGARLERDIAKALAAYFGIKATRRLGQARDGGEDLDIDIPFTIEIKARAEAPAAQKFLEQAQAAALDTARMPIAIIKGDRQQPVVLMFLTDWLELAMPTVQQYEREAHHRGSRKVTTP